MARETASQSSMSTPPSLSIYSRRKYSEPSRTYSTSQSVQPFSDDRFGEGGNQLCNLQKNHPFLWELLHHFGSFPDFAQEKERGAPLSFFLLTYFRVYYNTHFPVLQ